MPKASVAGEVMPGQATPDAGEAHAGEGEGGERTGGFPRRWTAFQLPAP